jgi:5-methylcytosine-specific restriction endonuclease McrA
MTKPAASRRPAIRPALAAKVFKRDGWICQHCYAPVVFAPALRLMETWATARMPPGATPPAYWNKNWRRDRAPLLDHLGAVVDHEVAYVRGGGIDEKNLVTACNKCNIRKSDAFVEDHRKRHPKRKVRSVGAEPDAWDGLSLVFLELARQSPEALTANERAWVQALR